MIRVNAILLAASAILLLTAQVSEAGDSRFSELLARAKVEAAAGHRVGPLGDNLTETFMAMIEILPQATPQQLAEFDVILQQQRAALATSTEDRAAVGERFGTGTHEAPIKTQEASIGESVVRPTVPAPSDAPTVNSRSPVETATIAKAVSPTAQAATANLPAAAADAAPPPASLSSVLAVQLLSRGQAAEAAGDISGARRLYRAAAERNDPAAATALAQLYDPAYLRQKAVGGIDADPAVAQLWYHRAKSFAAALPASHPSALTAR
jgi:hypothetical protein